MASLSLTEIIWNQFGAAIDSLESAIRVCPEPVWKARVPGRETPAHDFWYIVFHTLFWTDCYLHETSKTFAEQSKYGVTEFDPEGAYPDRIYSQGEMLEYLAYVREKCRARVSTATEESLYAFWDSESKKDFPVLELHLYNMRHVQHHAAQLNLMLRQTVDDAPKWVSRAKR